MLKFKGPRKLDDVRRLMKEKGMDIDSAGFDRGDDFILFKGGWHHLPLTIAYNTVNGGFSVYNGFTGASLATHLSDELEGEEWYRDLLETLYEKAED